MIFAAGLGTRLRPMTNDRPKALVTLGGRALLEIALERLRSFGVREVIVNVHHFADQIVSFLAANGNFGMKIEISREEDLLDTGGGLKKAAWFFLPSEAPFIVHNVDVISSTLAVADRPTSRPLLFDARGWLVRRGIVSKDTPATEDSAPRFQALAFCGIHVISPRIFAKLHEQGAFSIVDAHVRLATEGEPILGFRTDGARWRDLGRLQDLAEAERELTSGARPAN
jgi:NDP-sugar pyrophosphorylase family protein